MKENTRIIFDMDGTLYKFGDGTEHTFVKSKFGADIQKNVEKFFMGAFNLSHEDAISKHSQISAEFDGEVSLGLEARYDIPREEYFRATWDLDPQEYIARNPNLREMLGELQGKIALLTAAPRIWAIKVLSHLQIDDMFGDKIFTGDPNERKPNPVVFQKIASVFEVMPGEVFSIGDQEHTDIIPAKSIGMKAVRIGSSETIADYFANDIELAIDLLKRKGHI